MPATALVLTRVHLKIHQPKLYRVIQRKWRNQILWMMVHLINDNCMLKSYEFPYKINPRSNVFMLMFPVWSCEAWMLKIDLRFTYHILVHSSHCLFALMWWTLRVWNETCRDQSLSILRHLTTTQLITVQISFKITQTFANCWPSLPILKKKMFITTE